MAKSETRAGKTAAATRTSKLQKERDILAAIVDTAAALIVVLNPRGQIVHFNRACEEATGYSAEEMKNRHIWDMLIPAEQVNEVKAVFAKLISGDFPSQHENYWVAKDGARRLIAWTNTAIHDERGKIEYVIATGIDVTENRLAETELQYRTHQLGERVKELRCLYGVSRLREQRYLSLEEMLEGVVEIIPPAWQYPEITCARITLQGRAYCSKNFKKTQWMQSAEIVAEDENVGVVEVYYLEKRPEAAEGPFLEEERSLVDAIAERLSRIVERTWDEQRIMDYQRQLRHLASERFSR